MKNHARQSSLWVIKNKTFASHILRWYAKHGRHNLPWQNPRTPYHVWLSEIMLQQTQVITVIPYFEKFISHFPTLKDLANADIELILGLWSGLGYYARARNLHRTAKIVQEKFNGNFPDDLESLQTLPGIGRSTAGAILALGFAKRACILDGNVKRVLTRFNGIKEPATKPAVLAQLWALTEKYTPEKGITEYTQAMMDLGATLCTRTQPKCNLCPLQSNCVAYAAGNPADFPQKISRKSIPTKSAQFILFKNDQNEILLEKRPSKGIWGGLWSLPECDVADHELAHWCETQYQCKIEKLEKLADFQHVFSHYRLTIKPIIVYVKHWQPRISEDFSYAWYSSDELKKKGLPAPIKKIIEKNVIPAKAGIST